MNGFDLGGRISLLWRKYKFNYNKKKLNSLLDYQCAKKASKISPIM